jgi:MoxR-like ATPase
LSEALKRRCLYLHIGYPTIEREQEILHARLPGLDQRLAEQVARFVAGIRAMPLRKPPSVSESLDWAAALLALGVAVLDDAVAADTLNVLLKHQSDIDIVAKELRTDLTED